MISKINRQKRLLWDRFHLAKLRRLGSSDQILLTEEMAHSIKLQLLFPRRATVPRRATSRNFQISRPKFKELWDYNPHGANKVYSKGCMLDCQERARLSTQINSRPQLFGSWFPNLYLRPSQVYLTQGKARMTQLRNYTICSIFLLAQTLSVDVSWFQLM